VSCQTTILSVHFSSPSRAVALDAADASRVAPFKSTTAVLAAVVAQMQ